MTRKYMKNSFELANGQEAEEMIALLQKSLRRGEIDKSYFAALSMYFSSMGDYIWERLLIIAAEDMYGLASTVMTKFAEQYFEAKKTNDKEAQLQAVYKGVFFAGKGLKSRDADNIICIYYFNDFGKEKALSYLENTEPVANFVVDNNIFNVNKYEFEDNINWMKFIKESNNDTADYVKFNKNTMPDYLLVIAAIKKAFANNDHISVDYLFNLMVDNDRIQEAWTLLKELYINSTPKLLDEFKAFVFAKEFISQEKESKLYFGKVIILYLLLKENKDITNNLEIVYDKDFVKKYYEGINLRTLPAYTYDLHTTRGRLMMFTQREFLWRENNDLTPKSKNILFDDELEKYIDQIIR